jgi:hypothetical protein
MQYNYNYHLLRHLKESEKLNSIIPQDTGYKTSDIIYPRNGHQ